ncbi:MAG: hypothetical protein R3Y22_01050 [Bacteroidales bacterium]
METKTVRKIVNFVRLFGIVALLLLISLLGLLLTVYEHNCCWLSVKMIDVIGKAIASLSILFAAWLIISILYSYMKRSYVIIGSFVLMYLFGIFVYDGSHIPVGDEVVNNDNITNILAPINSTLSAFFPSRGDYSKVNKLENPLLFHTFHICTYFFVALFMFSLLGRKMLNRSSHLLISYRHRNIFWGYSDNGLALAESLECSYKSDYAIFVLQEKDEYEKNSDNYRFDQINMIEGIVLYADFQSVKTNVRSYSGARHFFMTEDQDLNVKMALRVLNGLLTNVKLKHITKLYIRCELEGIKAFFDKKIGERNDIQVHIYNHSDITARTFVADNPIIDHPALEIKKESCTVEGQMNVLFLGLGWTGLELLKKTVCDAQFIGDNYHFSATVIDKDFSDKHGRYKYLFEDATDKTCGAITFNPEWEGKRVDCTNGELFYDWLNADDRILKFERIIVALGDDELNINTAIHLTKFRMRKQPLDKSFEKIFAHVRNFQKYKYYMSSESLINVFGDLKQTNSCEVMINESLNRAGMLVNYIYFKADIEQFTEDEFDKIVSEWSDIESFWLGLSDFDKLSSSAVAMNISNIIKFAGNNDDDLKEALKNSNFLEACAEMEHLRWNAFHYVNGIINWGINDFTTDNGKLKIDGLLVKHVCLVPYRELDEVSERVTKKKIELGGTNTADYKASDRRIVRHFPYINKHTKLKGSSKNSPTNKELNNG